MKLRNKKTGEIGTYLYSNAQHYGIGFYSVMPEKNPMGIIEYGHDFEKLYKEWDFIGEDYNEPKDFWYIDDFTIMCGSEGEYTAPDIASFTKKDIEKLRVIGNYFATEEEAERAVEKLKAWKRLKDAGFRFNRWIIPEKPKKHVKLVIEAEMDVPPSSYELGLLFGGEE